MFEVTQQGGVAVLSMRHGKANAMDVELCEGLAAKIHELCVVEVSAIVLVGQGRIFSAGVDLMRIAEGGAAYVEKFLPALSHMFNTVFACPKPVVAAINGAAIAGGCVLACAADQRVLAQGARIGVPELKVGVPFPTSALEIMRFAATHRYQQSIVYGADTFVDHEALVRGLADEVIAPESVLDRSIEIARSLADYRPESFAITKRQLRGASIRAIHEAETTYDREVLAAWRAPEVSAGIRSYMEKTFKRG